MLPRYGKNYSIISQLAPGPLNLSILFQQNAYPAQKFAINVPEKGSRGFLLMREGEHFSLYDIEQQFYIPAGNNIEDDKVPTTKAAVDIPTAPAEPETPKTVATTKTITKTVAKKPVSVKKPVIAPKPKIPAKTTIVKNDEPAGPRFMDDIELNNPRTASSSSNLISKDGADAEDFKNPIAIINSDCPKAISNGKFETIYNKLTNKSPDERVKYLLEQLGNCYTTNQVRSLTRALKGDDEKLTFLKAVYSRVTDQSAFPKLENLFGSDEWKGYFRAILPQ